MPKYTVEDKAGKRITFEWSGSEPPTDSDMEEVFAAAKTEEPKAGPTSTNTIAKTAYDVYKPVMQGIGVVAGGGAGAVAGAPTGPGAVATGIAGGALGYGIMGNVADRIGEATGAIKPMGLEESSKTAVKDIDSGAMIHMGGEVLGKIVPPVVGFFGKIGKAVWGRLTGTGTEAIEQAVKSGLETGLGKGTFKNITDFDRALRGKISGEEVVTNAKEALTNIKNMRADTYRKQLIELRSDDNPIDYTQIRAHLKKLTEQYGIKQKSQGLFQGSKVLKGGKTNYDYSETAIGKNGAKDVKEMVDIVSNWKDHSASGLDTLKRQLDDFYSESSGARAFVTSLRNKVKSTIVNEVPEYATMMKDYEQATTMIKDLEAGLMLRKQGMTGRVVADQTLRRLMSAMRDNFELRADLLKQLGDEGGKDVIGQVAGHSLNQVLPRGLAGSGPVLGGEALLFFHYLNPKFWPLIGASSPRVAGEFLRMYGKALSEVKGITPVVAKAVETVAENSIKPKQTEKPKETKSAIPMGKYKTPMDVREAYGSGEITEESAELILKQKFGYE